MAHVAICGRTVGLAACAVLVLAAGGCGGESRVFEVDSSTFQAAVLDSPQPVLIDFYKHGCPFCIPLDPVMDELSKEYAGRVKVCRFMIMTSYWTFPAPEIKSKYEIAFVPTVLLFNKGKELQRWAVNYSADAYRSGLDKIVDKPGGVALPKETKAPPAK